MKTHHPATLIDPECMTSAFEVMCEQHCKYIEQEEDRVAEFAYENKAELEQLIKDNPGLDWVVKQEELFDEWFWNTAVEETEWKLGL